MKFFVLFLSIFACGYAAPTYAAVSKGLKDDMNELISLMWEVFHIIIRYLEEGDAEVLALAKFLLGDDFEARIVALDAEPSFLAVLGFIEGNNFPIYNVVNEFHMLFDIPPVVKPAVKPVSRTLSSPRGLKGLRDEILAGDLREKWYHFHCGKMAAGNEYAILLHQLSGQEFRNLVNVLGATDSWRNLVKLLEESKFHVHIDVAVGFMKRLFNWDNDNVDFCVNYVPLPKTT